MKKVHDYSKRHSFPLLIAVPAVSHSIVLHKERQWADLNNMQTDSLAILSEEVACAGRARFSLQPVLRPYQRPRAAHSHAHWSTHKLQLPGMWTLKNHGHDLLSFNCSWRAILKCANVLRNEEQKINTNTWTEPGNWW